MNKGFVLTEALIAIAVVTASTLLCLSVMTSRLNAVHLLEEKGAESEEQYNTCLSTIPDCIICTPSPTAMADGLSSSY